MTNGETSSPDVELTRTTDDATPAVGTLAQSTTGLAPLLPDPTLTPGDVLEVTKDDFCTEGYSRKVRRVPLDLKRQVYAEYGINQHARGEYEVDHLVSLELGGSNSIKNLWPESCKTRPWNARVKDRLENRLHEMICDGEIETATAQQAIAANWIDAYKKYVGGPPRAERRSWRRNGSANSNYDRSPVGQ